MRYFTFFTLFAIVLGSDAMADNVVNTQPQNTATQNTKIVSSMESSAKEWNLTLTEWTQYQILMQGPAGYYYSHLTPPEILGHYAKDNEEMRHFAEIHAKLEHDKIERELRFNKAFQEAAARLYANEPIIKPFDMSAYTPILKK